MIVGVDGGNSKTELLAATADGEPLAHVRGPGSNSHGIGAAGTIAVVGDLWRQAGLEGPADVGVLYLCGADLPHDVEELERAAAELAWLRRAVVDNDTFALLRAGATSADAVAVICGAGFNYVGRSAAGGVARYPALGWETGDWGGGDALARDAVFLAARAEDGRGEPTALAGAIAGHFGAESAVAVGEAYHYRRLPLDRLREIAPLVLAAAEAGDSVARSLVERQAEEAALAALRALADLGLAEAPAEVVLGGGLVREGGLLHAEIEARLAARAPAARVVVLRDPPVVGAALAALDELGAPPEALDRLRSSFRELVGG